METLICRSTIYYDLYTTEIDDAEMPWIQIQGIPMKKIGQVRLTRLGKKILFISHLMIHPLHRGKGFGKKIMLEIDLVGNKKKVQTLQLHVQYQNLPAIRLYENYGYKQVGVDFDHLIYEKQLGQP